MLVVHVDVNVTNIGVIQIWNLGEVDRSGYDSYRVVVTNEVGAVTGEVGLIKHRRSDGWLTLLSLACNALLRGDT